MHDCNECPHCPCRRWVPAPTPCVQPPYYPPYIVPPYVPINPYNPWMNTVTIISLDKAA